MVLVSCRSHFVHIENGYSKNLSELYGVSPGSIFGPLLFLIFVNSIPYKLPVLSSYIFANSTKISKSIYMIKISSVCFKLFRSIVYHMETQAKPLKSSSSEFSLSPCGVDTYSINGQNIVW